MSLTERMGGSPNAVASTIPDCRTRSSLRSRGHDVVRPHEVELVDVGLRDKFVDVDGARALERDVVEFVLVAGDVSVRVDL
jgi:hypothetical protein